MMCGPPCTYADYKRFIEGTNGVKDSSTGAWSSRVLPRSESPSPWRPFFVKLSYALVSFFVMLFVAPKCDPLLIVDEEFLNTVSLGRRILTGILFLGQLSIFRFLSYF